MTDRMRPRLLALSNLVLAMSLLLSSTAARSVAAQTTQPATPVPLGPPGIRVIKRICQTIGEQDTCNGRDTSLDGYSIEFDISPGTTPPGTVQSVLNVTIGQRGDGSMGENALTIGSSGSTWTVCEVPVAVPPGGGQPVDLNAVPRPPLSGGGSDQQVDPNWPLCIIVQLTSGESVLQFDDTVAAPTPTPTTTPTPTSTSTSTPAPQATATSTPISTVTPTVTPTVCVTTTATPTASVTPTSTATSTVATVTSTPSATATDTPQPTDTPTPQPTDTPTPQPTSTNTPRPTDTPTEEPDTTSGEMTTPGPMDTPGAAFQFFARVAGAVRLAQQDNGQEDNGCETPVATSTPTSTSTVTPTPVAPPLIALSKSVDLPNAAVGDTVTYTLVVTNSGSTPLVDSQVEDLLPPGLTFQSADNGGTYDDQTRMVGWNTGPLAPGAQVTLSYTAVTSAGTWDNAACVDADDADEINVFMCAHATVSVPEVPSATPTSTATGTPMPTATGTLTPTATETITPTPAASVTTTATPTSTATSAPTATGGAAISKTATLTSTPTSTATPSLPSATQTETPSPTATSSPTPTAPPSAVLYEQVLGVAIEAIRDREQAGQAPEELQPPVQLPDPSAGP